MTSDDFAWRDRVEVQLWPENNFVRGRVLYIESTRVMVEFDHPKKYGRAGDWFLPNRIRKLSILELIAEAAQ